MISFVHATSSANAQLIDADLTLLPRGNKEGNWTREYQVPSAAEFVYFSNPIDTVGGHFHGLRVALRDGSDEYVLYKVDDLPEENLYPEENFFCPAGPYEIDAAQEGQKKMRENKHLWKDAYNKRGLCAHLGPVSVKNAEREVFKIKESPIKWMTEPVWTFNEMEFRWQIVTKSALPIIRERLDQYHFFNSGPNYTWHAWRLKTDAEGNRVKNEEGTRWLDETVLVTSTRDYDTFPE